jgi:cytidylate kinase
VNETDLSSMLPEESPHHGFRGVEQTSRPAVPAALSVAISRESGARGGTIGRRVGRKLGWEVYDQELLDHVVQEGTVQEDLLEGLSEEGSRWVEDWLNNLKTRQEMDLSGPITNIARTTLALGAQGHVVLIGRGAGFLLPRPSTLHVRLVAPLEERIAYMAQWLRLTPEEARQRVRVRDARRNEFLTTFLHRQPNEIHCYDLLLNTSSLGEELCTDLIVEAARAKEALTFGRSESSPEIKLK